MLSKHLRVSGRVEVLSLRDQSEPRECKWLTFYFAVIAKNALQQESEEFPGEYQDPINIHIENDRDSCPC